MTPISLHYDIDILKRATHGIVEFKLGLIWIGCSVLLVYIKF